MYVGQGEGPCAYLHYQFVVVSYLFELAPHTLKEAVVYGDDVAVAEGLVAVVEAENLFVVVVPKLPELAHVAVRDDHGAVVVACGVEYEAAGDGVVCDVPAYGNQAAAYEDSGWDERMGDGCRLSVFQAFRAFGEWVVCL